MSNRLIVDVESLYAHSRDKLSDLTHKGRRTGGLFGVMKTVDAAVRRFIPEVVVLCFGDSISRIYLDDDALKLALWGSARGFHTTYMRGGTSEETIKKVTLDMLGDVGFDLVVQSWDANLHSLLSDKRVSLISLSDDELNTHATFKEEHGYDVRFVARSQQNKQGDLAAIPPNPNVVTLTSVLDELGFESILEEVKAGDVRPLESKAISL